LLDWSYDLLDDQEQTLFSRLSVFSGGWTLEAAEQVCSTDEGVGEEKTVDRRQKTEVSREKGKEDADYSGRNNPDPNSTPYTLHPTPLQSWEVLDLLSSLVGKSLVVYEDPSGVGRYRMLETIREYAREKLGMEVEGSRYSRRHQDYFVALAEETKPKLIGPEQVHWFEVLETEHDNLRRALRFCLEEEEGIAEGLRLGAALQQFWKIRGHWSEGREQLSALLGHPLAQERTKARADALHSAGSLAKNQCDCTSARSQHEESLAIRRELGDRQGIANSILHLGIVAGVQGDYAEARSLYQESLGIQRELGDRPGMSVSLNNLGIVACYEGDYASAQSIFQEFLGIQRELGNKWGIAGALNNLGNMAVRQGDYAAARSLWEESLSIYREVGSRWGIANVLHSLGYQACRQGDFALARSLYQESLGIQRELGDKREISSLLDGLAELNAIQEQEEEAARLWGAAERLREEIGSPLVPDERDGYDRNVAEARTKVSEEAFSAAWAQGRAMVMEQAVEYALQDG
jgi:tetratricopeptide (TPR) repeat protein